MPKDYETMPSFTTTGSYDLKSKGLRVYTITPGQLPEGTYDPDVLRGTEVIIDGECVKVQAVETFCIPRSFTHPYSHSFGLAVKTL